MMLMMRVQLTKGIILKPVHISLAAAIHLSVTTNFWVSCCSLKVLCATPQDCLTKIQGHKVKNLIFDMFIFFAIFVRFLEDTRLVQDCCKTRKV